MIVSVVIPVFNEMRTLERVIKRVQAVPVEKEIILVDDYSNDGSRELVQSFGEQPNVRAVLHEYNQGKGAALRSPGSTLPHLESGKIDTGSLSPFG